MYFGGSSQNISGRAMHRKELHPGIEPQIVEPQPDQEADDAERHQRPEQKPARALVDPLADHVGEDRHERKVIGRRSQNRPQSFGAQW